MSNKLAKLAIALKYVSNIEGELESQIQDLTEELDCNTEEEKLFESAINELDDALGIIQGCLAQFRTTFGNVEINQQFITDEYWVWTKTSESNASGVFRIRNRFDEEFEPNRIVYVIPGEAVEFERVEVAS